MQREMPVTKVLPLAGLHLQLGCHPAPVNGWSMPLWYEGALDEHELTRRSAGVFDRSHLGRFYVTGERAGDALGRVLATDPGRVPVGSVGRAVACREDGTVLDIPTLCHLDEGRWLVITGTRAADEIEERLLATVRDADAAVGGVGINDRRIATAHISLQGPQAAAIFADAFSPSFLASLPRGGCRELLLGRHRAAVARASQVGEDGFWLLLTPEDGGATWRAFLDSGAVSAGLAAHDALRLEAAVLEAPAETPAPATPEAAGLGALVDLSRDFPGAEALRAAGEPSRRVAGLRLAGPRLARPGSRVVVDGHDAGACVAAGFSPALEAGIALAYLEPGVERAESLDVDTDGERSGATVVPLPFVAPR